MIWDGVDTSVVEGDKIDMQITGIVDNGTTLAISWTAAYAGTPVNPCNTTPAASTRRSTPFLRCRGAAGDQPDEPEQHQHHPQLCAG